jgi:hypothetical protein
MLLTWHARPRRLRLRRKRRRGQSPEIGVQGRETLRALQARRALREAAALLLRPGQQRARGA